jgi:aryl-alcohol dehydrogenase-like predicted oxidoreductase
MQMRKLGNQGLVVSELGLGRMGMSEFYGSTDDQEAIATIHHAIDLGINFLDTADMYGPFTKFGNVRTPDGQFLGVSGKPDYVHSACDASLQRLGIDTIDLYYQHRVDPTVPTEETLGAMAELVQQGKVPYLGMSEVEQVKAIAIEKGVSPSQLALAWLLAQGNDVVPIPGTKRRNYLEENVAAVNITLTPDELQQIDAVAPKGIVVGERYATQHMSAVNR